MVSFQSFVLKKLKILMMKSLYLLALRIIFYHSNIVIHGLLPHNFTHNLILHMIGIFFH